MSTPVCLDPDNGIWRLVKNGDDAANPSDMQNVIFDMFAGNRSHGVFIGGVVEDAELTHVQNPLGPNQTSNNSYLKTISLGNSFTAPPQFLFQALNPSTGGWTTQYSSGAITYENVNNVLFPRGSILIPVCMISQTEIKIGYNVVSYPNAVMTTPPTKYTYRVFRL